MNGRDFRREALDRLLAFASQDTDECIEWPGVRYHDGYGRVNEMRAHRLVCSHFIGVIPRGHVVMHKCDNKPCVNWRHLEIGTDAQNIADAWARGLVPRPPMPGHGTDARYQRGCKCENCHEAHRSYMREYGYRRKENGGRRLAYKLTEVTP